MVYHMYIHVVSLVVHPHVVHLILEMNNWWTGMRSPFFGEQQRWGFPVSILEALPSGKPTQLTNWGTTL